MGRTLLAITVYNGRAFTPRALGSAARLQTAECDVLVLDDCSPEPGWSAELAILCENLGIGYYRSPRNLGIPRNFNLALLLCEDGGYDAVIIANSDVIFPSNLISSMEAVAEAERPQGAAPIASVMAWTNSASIYSLPNLDPDRFLADEPTVDSISSLLAQHFGPRGVEIPVGVGFCILIRHDAISAVGLFDPVFGRGYCEEVDWCRRAVERGWVNVLAPGVFVYHMGGATNRDAGLLRPGEQTVHVNEDIVDRRHPDYRDVVAAWEADGSFAATVQEAVVLLVGAAARERGYVLEATWLNRPRTMERAGVVAAESGLSGLEPVQFEVAPDVGPAARSRPLQPSPSTGVSSSGVSSRSAWPDPDAVVVHAVADGFVCAIAVTEGGVLGAVADFVGVLPAEVRIHAPGSVADQLRAEAGRGGVALRELARYPELV